MRAWVVALKGEGVRKALEDAILWSTRQRADTELAEVFADGNWEVREVDVRLMPKRALAARKTR